MLYHKIKKAIFLSRPNRFIAHCLVEGEETVCHVKNTGRCRELLTNGAVVYLEQSSNPNRKTKYDLIAVEKNGVLVNMDSAAPNKAAGGWLAAGGLLPTISLIRPETRCGDSRFDFYLETAKEKVFLEVKGVTLEDQGVAMFPDAPTLRGTKHINGLIHCVEAGYQAYLLFVIQMQGVHVFRPNRATDPAFANALMRAFQAGVNIVAMDCIVTPEDMVIHQPIQIELI